MRKIIFFTIFHLCYVRFYSIKMFHSASPPAILIFRPFLFIILLKLFAAPFQSALTLPERKNIMRIPIEALSINPQKNSSTVSVDIPSICPRCGVSHGREPLISYICKPKLEPDLKQSYVYSLYFCSACDRCFYVTYRVWISIYGVNNSEIVEVLPAPLPKQDFSERLKELSPKFIEIYQQSQIAEDAGLSELCGMGYRKALEFLVKD